MSKTPKDKTSLYDVLGVPPTATPEEIESAFRRQARQWHPDVSAEADVSAADFKAVAHAYEVLSDPEKRRVYDRQSHYGARSVGGRARRKAPFSPLDDLDADLGAAGILAEMDSLIDAWLRHGPGVEDVEFAPPDEDLDVEAELVLTPEEAAWGGWVEFALAFPEPCPVCEGQGRIGPRTCWDCSGWGTVRGPSRLVQLEVPPGLPDGTVLCLRGRGRPTDRFGPSGDLFLRIRVRRK